MTLNHLGWAMDRLSPKMTIGERACAIELAYLAAKSGRIRHSQVEVADRLGSQAATVRVWYLSLENRWGVIKRTGYGQYELGEMFKEMAL